MVLSGNKHHVMYYTCANTSVCSPDLGVTWQRKGKVAFENLNLFSLFQILTAGTKPSAPAWSGIGDFDVVRTGDCI